MVVGGEAFVAGGPKWVRLPWEEMKGTRGEVRVKAADRGQQMEAGCQKP